MKKVGKSVHLWIVSKQQRVAGQELDVSYHSKAGRQARHDVRVCVAQRGPDALGRKVAQIDGSNLNLSRSATKRPTGCRGSCERTTVQFS